MLQSRSKSTALESRTHRHAVHTYGIQGGRHADWTSWRSVPCATMPCRDVIVLAGPVRPPQAATAGDLACPPVVTTGGTASRRALGTPALGPRLRSRSGYPSCTHEYRPSTSSESSPVPITPRRAQSDRARGPTTVPAGQRPPPGGRVTVCDVTPRRSHSSRLPTV